MTTTVPRGAVSSPAMTPEAGSTGGVGDAEEDSVMAEGLRVMSATEAGWDAVDAVFATEAGARNCWCQFHVLPNADAALTTRESRRELS